MNGKNDLLIWLSDILCDPITSDDILIDNHEKMGFKPILTFMDGTTVQVHKVPHTAIKKKYKLVSTDVPIYYYDNIRLIRKIENFLEVPFIMDLEHNNWNILLNLSSIIHDNNTQQTTYKEDYALHLLVNHGDYQIIKIQESTFFETLDEIMTEHYVSMLLDKKFSELNKSEMKMIKIYHYQ